MSLRDVLCQERAIGSLRRAVEGGRLAHAYIFAGEEGVGKFTTAREFAQMLLCHNLAGLAAAPKAAAKKADKPKPAKGLLFEGDSKETNATPDTAARATVPRDGCGHCESCRLIDAGTHPDFHVVYKELKRYLTKSQEDQEDSRSEDSKLEERQPELIKSGPNKKIATPVELPVKVIREYLIKQVANSPKLGQHSVFVVKEMEKSNISSENAMLKILEEPPKHCTIILLCTQADLLLPTIRSRCQLIRFGRVDETMIVDRLVGQGVERTEALFWARFSQGSLGTAQVWAGTDIGEPTIYQVKRELVDRLANLRPGEVLETAERIVKVAKEIAEAWEKGAENANKSDLQRKARKGLLRMIIGVYEDAMTSAVAPGRAMIHADQAGAIERIRQGREAESLADGVEAGYEKLRWIESHVNERLIFEQYLFRLCGCDTIQFLSVE